MKNDKQQTKFGADIV